MIAFDETSGSETSSPSFYHDVRRSPEIIARRRWTRQMPQKKPSDPVIDEIRKTRHEISAAVDHDPVRLVAYYIELQKKYRDRLIDSKTTAEHSDQPAA